jgi:S-DNA-T family DNA segregation ATPase FtsK/SpoIIIE
MNNQNNWQKMLQEQQLPHQLRVQSQQIDKVLHSRQVDAQVTGGVVTSKSIQFNLQTQFNNGIERLKAFKEDILTALGVPDMKLMQEGGQWRLQINRVEEPPVALLELLSVLPDIAPGTAVMGLTDDGEPLLLDLTDPDLAHVLIAGDTGAGKTTLLRSLAVSLALLNKQSQLQLIVINVDKREDSSFAELSPLSYLPHLLESVVTDVSDGAELLQFLVDEMNYRIDQNVEHPMIVLFIDHFVTFLQEAESNAYEAILQLTQKGAQAGIHLVMSTQKPQSEQLTAVFKSSIPVRIIGHIADQQTSQSVAGNSDIHPDYLYGEGDFIAITTEGDMHFQAAYIGEYGLHLALDLLHRNRPRPIIAQTVEPVPTMADLVETQEPPKPEPEPRHFDFDGNNQSWKKPNPKPQHIDNDIPFEAGIDWQTEQQNKENIQ